MVILRDYHYHHMYTYSVTMIIEWFISYKPWLPWSHHNCLLNTHTWELVLEIAIKCITSYLITGTAREYNSLSTTIGIVESLK